MKKTRLGFIGIGIMGSQMTLRLLECGWEVAVWNLEPEALGPVVAAGARACASPAEVAKASEVVLVCVLHTQAVESVVFGANGIASSARSGQLLIDHSTAQPKATRVMAQRLRRERGMGWIDAPVSGGPAPARAGTLAVMAGGEAADVRAIEPIMTDLAANFTHVGPSGSGQIAKIINQAIVCTNFVVLAEAIAIAESAGIDAAIIPKALAGGFADGALLQRLYPQMQARDFEPPRGYARQVYKDLKAVKEFAHDLGLVVPVVESATAQFESYVAAGNEMTDSASIVRLYEKR